MVNTDKDYIKSGISYLVKDLKDMGVTILDNEYEVIKINGNIIIIRGIYAYTFVLNRNNDVDKDIMKDGVYDFLKYTQL